MMDTLATNRLEIKLDTIGAELGKVREQLAGMAERYAPRTDVAALDKRLVVAESDLRRMLAAIGAIGTLAVGAIADAVARWMG